MTSRSPIVVGITTFNPELTEFKECVAAARAESECVIVFDNGSGNQSAARSICSEADARLVVSDTNRGVSFALNRLAEEALRVGANSIVYLDQDSLIHSGALHALEAAASSGDAAMVASTVFERRTGTEMTSDSGPINFAITAGTMLHLPIWQESGGFDEALFVDFVDFDMCLRIRLAGQSIVRARDAGISHTIGKADRRPLGTIYNYPPERLAHMAEDMTYFAHKHRRTASEMRPRRTSPAAIWAVIVRKALLIGLYESNKAEKVGALRVGRARGIAKIRESRRTGSEA